MIRVGECRIELLGQREELRTLGGDFIVPRRTEDDRLARIDLRHYGGRAWGHVRHEVERLSLLIGGGFLLCPSPRQNEDCEQQKGIEG